MFRRCLALVFVGVLAVSTVRCSNSSGTSPAETQHGAASDLNRPPHAGAAPATCRDLPSGDDLKKWMEWATVVNRQGEICATSVATDEPASAWPGSQAISKAKAYTANAYSTDDAPLSTARLYTLTQPGHSLWGVGEPNPFRADCLVAPSDMNATNGKICGGSVAFGGGVALYKGKTRVGGLGVSGDTACADHEIAKRIRHLAQLDPEKGEFADDIIFTSADGPSLFAHPLCANAWRNGRKLGDEANAVEY
jgi:uncharacterized protein GlcG (DUF336 family)